MNQRDGALEKALEVLREPLPFTHVRLPEPRLTALDRFMESWCAECGLGDERSREVVRVYIEHCSPENADPRGVEMAAEFLLWFFALNDVPDGHDKWGALRAVRAILHGEDVVAPPFTAATRRFRDQILGARTDARLSAMVEAMFASFFWEIEHVGETPPAPAYQANREHTVAVYPYMDIYRSSLGVQSESALGADLATLERLSVEIIYLVNDILSVARDHRKGKQNFVFSIAADHGISWEDAVPRAMSHLSGRIEAFRVVHDGILSSSSLAPGHQAYLSFLASYLEGTRVATLVLRERYFGDA